MLIFSDSSELTLQPSPEEDLVPRLQQLHQNGATIALGDEGRRMCLEVIQKIQVGLYRAFQTLHFCLAPSVSPFNRCSRDLQSF
jgi:hypothetical protein